MMPPKGSRSLPPDVLSNLPDNVIDIILMCLPCKDAVRTSILSKKWRYHWCRLTELTLDSSLWETKKDLLDPTVKFTKIIYQILCLHEGPITKFTLNICLLESCPKIDNFIYFLSRNDIQHLVICLPRKKLYKLPSSVFRCSQLRHLTLHDCLIRRPLVFNGFDRLISLEICSVKISSKLLGRLISHCPLLEQLVLETSEELNMLEINAPMLRSFDFKGSIKSVCLKNVPLLEKASMIGNGSSGEAGNFDLAKLFESCYALDHLLLEIQCQEFYDDDPSLVPTRLPFDLNCVKRFHVPYIVLEESYRVACILCLIRSFPYLEYFEIEIGNEFDIRALECLEMDLFSDVTFNYLREVKLENFTGTTPEMQLIKLLLAKSPVLVRMLIDPYPSDEPVETRFKIVSELSNFMRASPEAEILWPKSSGS